MEEPLRGDGHHVPMERIHDDVGGVAPDELA